MASGAHPAQRVGAPLPVNEGRIVLVTGGCGGIGTAVARRVVAEGGRVALADINADAGAALVEDLGEDSVYFVHCDVKSEDSISKAFDDAAHHFGGLHGAVLAAGIVHHSHTTPLVDITAEEFDDTCNVNLRGTFLCLKHAARTMKKFGHGTGSIVTIASVAGLRGNPGIDPSYAVTKFGVIGLTQTAAAKLCADKIRVNCVAPTSVETPMTAAVPQPTDPEAAKATMDMAMKMLCPMHQRMVSAPAMAGIITFLLSAASSDVNGVSIPVDQGYAAGASGLM